MAVSNDITNSASTPDKDQIVDSILQIAQKEQLNGNKTITQEKLNSLTNYVLEQKRKKRYTSSFKPPAPQTDADTFATGSNSSSLASSTTLSKPLPIPQFSPLFSKFDISELKTQERKKLILHIRSTKDTKELIHSTDGLEKKKAPKKKLTFKRFERIVIEILETIANILDNLHLFSKLPMFPQKLVNLLKQTNKLWILILIFLIRKTISQLLNVISKERKVKHELKIVKQNSSKLLSEGNDDEGNILPLFKRYEKVIKDLKFDKTMLLIELVGNFLDLSFNLIEFYGVSLPEWFMSGLNAASMFMTIYRMNKDDEYVDDDVTEDLI